MNTIISFEAENSLPQSRCEMIWETTTELIFFNLRWGQWKLMTVPLHFLGPRGHKPHAKPHQHCHWTGLAFRHIVPPAKPLLV